MSVATIVIFALVASAFASWTGFLAAAIVTFGPVRLGLRGRTAPLRWTRRLGTVVGIEGVLVGAAVGASGASVGLGGASTAAVAWRGGGPDPR